MKVSTSDCKVAITNAIVANPYLVEDLFSCKSADPAKLKKNWKRNHKEKMKDGNTIRCFDCPLFSDLFGTLRAEVIDDGKSILNISIFKL